MTSTTPLPIQENIQLGVHLRLLATASDFQTFTDESKRSATPGHPKPIEITFRRWLDYSETELGNQAPFWHRVVRATVCAFGLFLSVFLQKLAYSY